MYTHSKTTQRYVIVLYFMYNLSLKINKVNLKSQFEKRIASFI